MPISCASQHLTRASVRGIDRAMSLGTGALGSVRAFGLSAPPTNNRFVIPRHLAETLAIAAAGGATLGLIGFPAGWLSGSILAVAGASLAGRPMLIPTLLMRAIFVLIGISLGAVVTPETLHGMATYPLSIAVLLLAMAFISVGGGPDICVSCIAGQSRRISCRRSRRDVAGPGTGRRARWRFARDRDRAEHTRRRHCGRSARRIVIARSRRPRPPRTTGVLTLAVLDELAILVAVSTLVALIAYWVRFPGGLLFGAMLTSAVLHGSGLIHAVMPWWVANTAMVAMGAITGSRFANTPPRCY